MLINFYNQELQFKRSSELIRPKMKFLIFFNTFYQHVDFGFGNFGKGALKETKVFTDTGWSVED